MTLNELKLIISHRKGFAEELHISPAKYDVLKAQLPKITTDPNRRTEHFLLDGMRIVRTFDPFE